MDSPYRRSRLGHAAHPAVFAQAADKLTINLINPPRTGKKLLVLDLDYTSCVHCCPGSSTS